MNNVKMVLELSKDQQYHKRLDDNIYSICKRLIESEDPSEHYCVVSKDLKLLKIRPKAVRDSVNSLIKALEDCSEVNIALCRQDLHFTLVDYRAFYENSENFLSGSEKCQYQNKT